jgi:hypothetical protein
MRAYLVSSLLVKTSEIGMEEAHTEKGGCKSKVFMLQKKKKKNLNIRFLGIKHKKGIFGTQ